MLFEGRGDGSITGSTQFDFFRSLLLMICTAEPCYTAAAAREHWCVLASILPTRGTNAKDAHACEVVRGLTVGQYVAQAKEFPDEPPRGRHDGWQEEKVALVVVVLVVVKLLRDGGIVV
jgi:hypothetical protein